jgi:hypothetical protein
MSPKHEVNAAQISLAKARIVLAALLVSMLAIGVSAAQADFGLQPGSLQSAVIDSSGAVEISPQAGAHPFAQQVKLTFNTTHHEYPAPPPGAPGGPSGPDPDPDGTVKTVITDLPPGLIGNTQAVPRCAQSDFPPAFYFGPGRCPTSTQVGITTIDIGEDPGFIAGQQTVPVFNLVPPKGVVARFGFVEVEPVIIDISIRAGGDYGVTATAQNVSQALNIYGTTLTLWGVPADPSHDMQRYMTGAFGPGNGFGGGLPSGLSPVPFLTNPGVCGVPLATRFRAASWEAPDNLLSYTAPSQTFVGCDRLKFVPSFTATPTTTVAGSPTGLSVNLHIPQNEAPGSTASAEPKDAVVAFPAGMRVNPAAADGLTGCSEAQIALHSPDPATCPDASQLGTVTVRTPLLKDPLQGAVYLASQGSNPFRSLLAMYIAIADPQTGIVVKLPGGVQLDPVTGQLTVSFDDNPQVPFEDLSLTLKNGPRAPLVTPRACGTYTTHSSFTSWAQPETAVVSDSSFVIDQGCDEAGRFEPSLSAGTISPLAGGSSPFTFTLSRPDGQQDLGSVALRLPPGLVGKLAGVPLCPDAGAASGACPVQSEVGKVTVAAGAGPAPLWVAQPGRTPTAVYLAGPYKGAPFSLSVVVPAQAGPFDLGTVVVRAALFVDEHDAHVSVVSDAFPTILDGVPLDLQKIDVLVDRPGFMVSPTSCAPSRVQATVASSAGATASVASRFQVDGCDALKFAPKLTSTVSTGAAAVRGRVLAPKVNGVALRVRLAYPPAAAGSQANIAYTKVVLPKQFPARLTTLQRACANAQFVSNPAGCPAGSIVGTANVVTPLLPVALTGPAILVSHGGEAFPALTMVLQGDGVTVELVGTTFISKAGVTSSTFKTVPDVPFSSFELTLPQGKDSLLAGNGDLCQAHLVIPTDYIAQNGTRLHQTNPVAIAACAQKASTVRKRLAAALTCDKQPKHTQAACRAQAARRSRSRR